MIETTVHGAVILDSNGGMKSCQFDHDKKTYLYEVMPCGRLVAVGWDGGSDTAKAAAMSALSQFKSDQGVSA